MCGGVIRPAIQFSEKATGFDLVNKKILGNDTGIADAVAPKAPTYRQPLEGKTYKGLATGTTIGGEPRKTLGSSKSGLNI